jgi:hypothetical protein
MSPRVKAFVVLPEGPVHLPRLRCLRRFLHQSDQRDEVAGNDAAAGGRLALTFPPFFSFPQPSSPSSPVVAVVVTSEDEKSWLCFRRLPRKNFPIQIRCKLLTENSPPPPPSSFPPPASFFGDFFRSPEVKSIGSLLLLLLLYPFKLFPTFLCLFSPHISLSLPLLGGKLGKKKVSTGFKAFDRHNQATTTMMMRKS